MKYVVDISVNGTPFPRKGHGTRFVTFTDDGKNAGEVYFDIKYGFCSTYVHQSNENFIDEYHANGWKHFATRQEFMVWFIRHAITAKLIK